MGDIVETPDEQRRRLGYDPALAVEALARQDADIAEQQVVAEWLYEHHDAAERELFRRQDRARALRGRLVADGVIES